MFTQKVLLLLSLLLLTGCVSAYKPKPLSAGHPAHPEAIAAPERQPSQTLAYKPSDVPSPQPASASNASQQRSRPSGKNEQQTVVGEGKVIAVVPSSSQVVVDHKEIKGFMDAMTMGYRVESPSLLEGLKAGDNIRFTIDTEKKAIVKIEK